jgi:acyl-coenzyme A synthetase/AMP-(fatty) acid ligase
MRLRPLLNGATSLIRRCAELSHPDRWSIIEKYRVSIFCTDRDSRFHQVGRRLAGKHDLSSLRLQEPSGAESQA